MKSIGLGQKLRQFNGYEVSPRLQILIRILVNELHRDHHGLVQHRLIFFEQIHNRSPHKNVDNIESFEFRQDLQILKLNVNPLYYSRDQVIRQLPIYNCELSLIRSLNHLRPDHSGYETQEWDLLFPNPGQDALSCFIREHKDCQKLPVIKGHFYRPFHSINQRPVSKQ